MSLCIFRTRDEIVYWKNGETLWRRAIALTKNNFIAHYCLAETLLPTKPDEALAEYQKSVAIYPDYDLAQLGLAWALNNHSRISEAIIHLEKATQLDPQNALAQDGLGELLFQSNQVGDAVPHLLKAVELDPQVDRFKDVLGRVLSSGDHGTEAVGSFLASMQSDPAGFGRFFDAVRYDTNRVDLINNLAWAFATNPDPKFRNGKYAVHLATRACEMTDYQTTIMVGTLAAAYAEAGRFDGAVATAEKAIDLAKRNGETELVQKNEGLLKLYRAHQPNHELIEGK
jgi:tetratricopeptide (TPR) repeat protein